jgi:hypothetical protein
VPPLITNLGLEFAILDPSTLIPGNLPIITSAKEVAPGEIPYPELFILSVELSVEDLHPKDKLELKLVVTFS